ncbi:hypothetical protein Leryth_027196 [Lithospermum erythrorhizon]|nr:hypothetical protein Leryth_027196 [Lithospermum erythrorhizon]
MESKLSCAAKSLTPSPIQQLSLLAQSCNAVNLAEGFPDFPAPLHIKNAAVSAINSDFNQYRHVQGICELVAHNMKQMHGLDVDPLTDIVITCGQSEAFASTMFALINQGDEVFVALDPPNWTLDREKLLKAFTNKTKAIVLNRYREFWVLCILYIR